MNSVRLALGILCGAFLSPLLPAVALAATPAMQPAHAPAPLYPSILANEPVNYGAAWVGCTVDDDGRVLETWTLRASHPAFGEAAEKALREWRYEPRPAGASGPWPRSEVVRFDFGRPGHVASFSAIEALKGIFPYQPESLAAPGEPPLLPPRSLKRLVGASPRPPAGAPAGRVLVEFLVDAEGRVRLPVALESAHPVLARAALEAVRGWRFAAPPPEIEAPAVRLRWAFRFGPAEVTGKATRKPDA